MTPRVDIDAIVAALGAQGAGLPMISAIVVLKHNLAVDAEAIEAQIGGIAAGVVLIIFGAAADVDEASSISPINRTVR